MEPEGSLSHSKVPATCFYPEPARSSLKLRSYQRISPGPRPLGMFRNLILLSARSCY